MNRTQETHRAFLNTYYGKMKHIYDLSRKFFLFGRNRALEELLGSQWNSMIEVGPGTGRNLELLHKNRPEAVLGGLEASDEMLSYVQKRCPWAKILQGFAENTNIHSILGKAPDRILFSYCLTMVQSQSDAIQNARNSLSPTGELIIVDFGDMKGLPAPLRVALTKWMALHHVHPLSEKLLKDHGARLTWGPGRYYVIARLGPSKV